MTSPRLVSLATTVPSHRLTTSDAQSFARRRFAALPGIDRLLGVFEHTGIAERWLARPIDWYEEEQDFPTRNAVWATGALRLAERAASLAIDRAGIDRSSLAAIVLVSSTGIATPSLDSHLVQMLGLSRAIARVPLFGLGCAGGAAGLARAATLCRGLGAPVLLVAVEICSATFLRSDCTESNLVATALFADGAAAAVVAPGGAGPAIVAGHSLLVDDTESVMGWTVRPDGWQVRFSRNIPEIVRELVPAFVDDAAQAASVPRTAIEHYAVHPGGAKVLRAFEDGLGLAPAHIDTAYSVLRRCGNMSSPTVLFVLEEMMRARPPSGAHGVALALGPGFCAEGVVLRW